MGLFDFFKPSSKPTPPNKKPSVSISVSVHEPTPKEFEAQRKAHAQEKVRNFQKDEAGLYPHEILMLSYLEKYTSGKSIARFWEYEYGVEDVHGLIKSLEERGFSQNGKLTDLGKIEIEKNEYVQYMHRHKFSDISMADMSILVNKYPGANYRDLLWGEFNRLSLQYMNNRRFGLYRNIKHTMCRFVLEEKRYHSAFSLLAEVFFYDLNGSTSPFIAPALVKDLRSLEQKLDYTDEQMIDTLRKLFQGMYAPHKNYTNDEVTCIIVAYAFGHDEMAENILKKKRKR